MKESTLILVLALGAAIAGIVLGAITKAGGVVCAAAAAALIAVALLF